MNFSHRMHYITRSCNVVSFVDFTIVACDIMNNDIVQLQFVFYGILVMQIQL